MSIGADFDAVLVAAQTGGEWAVAVLYRDVNPRLLRYLRAKAPDVAEDLASEVWLAAARHLPTFEGDEAAFRGWMFTMARRQAMGHWRKQGRRRTHPVPVDALAERAGPDDPEAAGLAALGAQEAVEALVAALPGDQAEVVLLRVLAGLDVEQVAEIMGKRPGTVRVLQHQALRRLARSLPAEVVTR